MPPAGIHSSPLLPPHSLLQVLKALLAAKEAADATSWQAFQAEMLKLKLQRTRAEREAQEVRPRGRGGGRRASGEEDGGGYQAQVAAHPGGEAGADRDDTVD